MTSLQVTAAMVLNEREEMRRQGGRLAHTYDVNNYAKLQENCDCHTCGDAFDPTGEKTAARLNAPPSPIQGLQPAASIHPDLYANPLHLMSTPTHQLNPLHFPSSPPKLQRQHAVYYDDNGVDILGMVNKPVPEQSSYSRECDLTTAVILNSTALIEHTREELEALLHLQTFTHEQALRLARLHARKQALKALIAHFDMRNL